MTIRKNIEFDELIKAQDILKNGFEKGVLTRSELAILAKYYSSIGITGIKLKKELIDFCYKHSFGFNEIIHRKTIDNAIKVSEKYNLKLSDNVVVTKKEMDIVRSLPSKYGKVLFIIIVTAKHSKAHPNKKVETYKLDNNKYYSYHRMRELVGLARLSMGEEEMLDMCQQLAKYNSYIKPIQGRDYLYEVLCIDENGEEEIVVNNMNNIINFFPLYCEKCGKIIEKLEKSKKHNMCKNCYEEKRKETIRESVKKHRDKVM